VEFGESPAGQGKRNDLKEVSDLILAGANLQQIAVSHGPTFLKYHNGIAKMISTVSVSRDWETEVYWLWGPTGSGKTRWVHETCDRSDLYVKDGTNKWFCGYTNQKNVLFDDFRPSTEIPFSRLLRLLDRYSMLVETKGGTVNFNPHRIFITTPNKPAETFQHIDWIKDEDIRQLTRRITKVIEFSEALRHMPFALIPLATPVPNTWDHSVPQNTIPLLPPPQMTIPSQTPPIIVRHPSPAPVTTVGQLDGPPRLSRQKRMKVKRLSTPSVQTKTTDTESEPSDAEAIDEFEIRSDDSGTEGSLCEFLNNGNVTESDYSSASSSEDEQTKLWKNARGRTRHGTKKRKTGLAINKQRVIIDSDSD